MVSGAVVSIDGEEHLVWDAGQARLIPVSKQLRTEHQRFLKGPIPWWWMERAAAQPGKALEVGLCLWRLAGAMRSRTVRLGNREVERLGVDRHAKSRALAGLRCAGLVRLELRRGRAPVVTILANNVPSPN